MGNNLIGLWHINNTPKTEEEKIMKKIEAYRKKRTIKDIPWIENEYKIELWDSILFNSIENIKKELKPWNKYYEILKKLPTLLEWILFEKENEINLFFDNILTNKNTWERIYIFKISEFSKRWDTIEYEKYYTEEEIWKFKEVFWEEKNWFGTKKYEDEINKKYLVISEWLSTNNDVIRIASFISRTSLNKVYHVQSEKKWEKWLNRLESIKSENEKIKEENSELTSNVIETTKKVWELLDLNKNQAELIQKLDNELRNLRIENTKKWEENERLWRQNIELDKKLILQERKITDLKKNIKWLKEIIDEIKIKLQDIWMMNFRKIINEILELLKK